MEYVKAIQDRYHRAKKQEKSCILEEFCRTNDYNRKYAIRLLNGPPPEKVRIRRRRAFFYSAEVIRIAEEIWKAASHPCGDRLKAIIPLWLPAVRQRFRLSPEIEGQLLSISARQLDTRLSRIRRVWKKRIYSTTRPGSLLKRMIPIRTSNWDIRKPGFLEIDLVAHCGSSASGQFIYTLNATDLATGWTECRAIPNRGRFSVVEALKEIIASFPFPIRGIDSDNGEEFINYHLLAFCVSKRIGFTRSRPYKKDDNAHIEQKNWTRVRQAVGWDRYDSQAALGAMNGLYTNELRLFQNLLQPSAKLIRRSRVGSRRVRKHDKPRTPFQRLLDAKAGNPQKIAQLKDLLNHLDPFALSATIDEKLADLLELATPTDMRAVAVGPAPNFAFSPSARRQRALMLSLKRSVAFTAEST
jgi:hypothetical protein